MTQRLMTAGLPYTTSPGIAEMRWSRRPAASRRAKRSGPAAWRTIVRFLTAPRPLPDSLVDDVLSGSPSATRIRSELTRLDASLHARIY